MLTGNALDEFGARNPGILKIYRLACNMEPNAIRAVAERVAVADRTRALHHVALKCRHRAYRNSVWSLNAHSKFIGIGYRGVTVAGFAPRRRQLGPGGYPLNENPTLDALGKNFCAESAANTFFTSSPVRTRERAIGPAERNHWQ